MFRLSASSMSSMKVLLLGLRATAGYNKFDPVSKELISSYVTISGHSSGQILSSPRQLGHSIVALLL